MAAVLVWISLMAASACAQLDARKSMLDAGWVQMYNLQFDAAHRTFAQWQQNDPDDPLGPVSDAAAYLFSEFDRLHILQLEFLVDNQNFVGQKALMPDPVIKTRFFAQLDRTQTLISARLAENPKDPVALFANVLMLGLRGDYIALIEKRNLAGLSYIKNGRAVAAQLMAVDPVCYDAYLAVGVENYLLSLEAAPVRWLLRMTGAQTDKATGLQNLHITAEKGHFLQPYAQLLIAVAAMRDNEPGQAKSILFDLSQEFPDNTLYRQELARLEPH